MDDELKKAHTGEHILFQSLSRVFDGIKVEKINLTEEKKSLFVTCPETLDRKKILEAELLANKIISEGRTVRKFVGSVDEVKKKFGNKVRGKWDRITDKEITVVEVDAFDYAACSGEHVNNTKEIGMLLVTKINSLGNNLYEIQFEVDEKAKRKAIELANKTLALASILGSTEDKVERTAANLKEELLKYKKFLKIITRDCMKNINFENIKGIKFYSKIFSYLDDDEIGKRIGEMVKEEKTIVAVANEHLDNVSVILARSDDMTVNVLETLKEVCEELNGKCGGRESFAMGGIKAEKEKIIESIRNKLISRL